MSDADASTPAITASLKQWQEGDEGAFERVIEYVYDELHRRAAAYVRRERPNDTLQATALVHETFIKLVEKREIEWQDRNHFLAVAAQAMRRILVDRARARRREKRGGPNEDLPLDERTVAQTNRSSIDIESLDEALNQLASFDERQSRIVELKYFGGMTLDETADILEVSRATVRRDWQIARAWLRQRLG
ncbi:MAG TPA: sigma-70 family RNA polymerase sigma factor [Pyrinomonadaceae bacterium]|nr:sigma-70 family RNA polymerase sigma factor [Pyrinomonadaceae bacterium]